MVEKSPLLGEFDRTRRNVEAGDVGTEFGKNHRVLALTAADVENPLVVKIAHHPKAEFFRIERAGPTVSIDYGSFDRFQMLHIVLRPSIEELDLLGELSCNLHLRPPASRRWFACPCVRAARTRRRQRRA